jgi:hypothetical protein
MAGQVRGRCPAERVAPAGLKIANVEIAQVCDLDVERLSVRQCRTDLYAGHVVQAARRFDGLEVVPMP